MQLSCDLQRLQAYRRAILRSREDRAVCADGCGFLPIEAGIDHLAYCFRMIFSENRYPPRYPSAGQAFSGSCSSRIGPQQRGGRSLGPSGDLARARTVGDLKQQVDHLAAPQQPDEMLGHLGRLSADEPGAAGTGTFRQAAGSAPAT